MTLISIETKTDFFSKRVNNYSKQSADEDLTFDDDY
jgi:ribonucleotide reductase beta subunit family protein with ferritin-like domain